MSMKKLYLALIFLMTHFLVCLGAYDFSSASWIHNETEMIMVKKACIGNKGLCFWESKKKTDMEMEMEMEMEMGMEMEMDSEVNRRVLMMQQKRYISYETLKKDMTPCGRPGASYYNCHYPGQANPYTRGCEEITGCRNDIKN